jgi:hypothetical protein
MKIAIMQPYFYPYLGYFELIASVDKFIFFDDVNFKKKGFIHRNFINQSGENQQINLTLNKASQNKKINELEILDASSQCIPRILSAYQESNYYADVQELCEFHQNLTERNLAYFLSAVLQFIANKILRNPPEFLYSSDINERSNLYGEERIINLTQQLGGKEYFNLPGGKLLYSREKFLGAGLELAFLVPNLLISGHESNLSIIDAVAEIGWSNLRDRFISEERIFD